MFNLNNFLPAFVGGTGLALAQVTPLNAPTPDAADWSKIVITVVTVLVQIIHLVKSNKKPKENA